MFSWPQRLAYNIYIVSASHVQTVERNRLVGYVGTLAPGKMREVCRALAVATGCDGER